MKKDSYLNLPVTNWQANIQIQDCQIPNPNFYNYAII